MNRPFLFMSGEASITTILAFSNNKWEHTSVPTNLVDSDYTISYIRRENRPREIITGVIHYADVSDKSIEINNLNIIINKKILCWPDPKALLKMTNRHTVLSECYMAGFIDHIVIQSDKFASQIDFPFVLKTGTEHRGIGKYLINSMKDIPKWDGIASMEPFFKGRSIRVLIIDTEVFGIETVNELSWIKNSPGGEIIRCELSNEIIKHAKSITKYFNLQIAGIDYIVEPNGVFHFLEINQYPGVAGFDDIEDCAKKLFLTQMKKIEYGQNEI